MKHMNAAPLKPNKMQQILNNPRYVVEEKLKGIRAFLTFTETGCILTSRGGHDISARVPHLAAITIPTLIGVTIDGELFQRGVEDEIIAGWCNYRTKYIDPTVTKDVEFVAFDIYNTVLTQGQRRMKLEYAGTYFPPQIKVIKQSPISSASWNFALVLSEGGEGIMLKNLDALYIDGKRLQNIWYKLKGEATFDVIITGFEMAELESIKKGDIEPTPTKFAGLIGAFKYGMYVKRLTHYELVELGTCSGMTDTIRIDMTHNPDNWLDKVIEIKGVEQKVSGAIDNPRFIRMRLDKPREECIWEI